MLIYRTSISKYYKWTANSIESSQKAWNVSFDLPLINWYRQININILAQSLLLYIKFIQQVTSYLEVWYHRILLHASNSWYLHCYKEKWFKITINIVFLNYILQKPKIKCFFTLSFYDFYCNYFKITVSLNFLIIFCNMYISTGESERSLSVYK